MSSFGCKTLFIIIKFLLLRSICLRSSLIQFKKKVQKRRTDLVFIVLVRFQLQSLVSRSFLVLLKYQFPIIFLNLCLFDSPLQIFQSIFRSVLVLSWFGSFIPSVDSLSLFYKNALYVFNAKFHSYSQAVNSYHLYKCVFFFFILGKYLNMINIYKVVYLLIL